MLGPLESSRGCGNFNNLPGCGGLAGCPLHSLAGSGWEGTNVPSFAEFADGRVKTNDPDLLRQFQSVFGL